MKDLTKGHPGKVLLGYTLPLFGSIVFQQLYSIADSLVAGRYIGTDALSSVTNSYEITLIYIAVAFGCSMGASVVTARHFGMKNTAGVKSAIFTALLFAALAGVALAGTGILLSEGMLRLIRTPEKLMRDSCDYLNIYLWGYLFLIIYQTSTGIFSALGDSQTPFWFLAISSVANIFVDVWFVRDLEMGVKGVAYATFICQSLSGLAALAVLLLRIRALKTTGRGKYFSFRMLGQILQIGVPSALQQGCISLGNILIQTIINGLGPAVMGGYGAAVKLNNLCITSLTAAGNGVSNFASQNEGAGQRKRISQGAGYGALLGACVALLFTAVYQLLAQPLIGLFITDGNEQAARVGVMFLRIVTPFYCVVAMKLILDGVLRGLGRMNPFMISTMTDLALRVGLAFLLSIPFLSNGVWMAWPVGWSIATGMSLAFFLQWKREESA